MAEDAFEGQEKTEQATPRKREQARERGQIAKSPELSAAVVVLSGAAALSMVAGRGFAGATTRLMHDAWAGLARPDGGLGNTTGWLQGAGLQMLAVFASFGGLVMLMAVAVNVVQTRGLITTYPITPKLSGLNPMQGVQRLFSLESLFTVFKSILKLGALGLVTFNLTRKAIPDLLMLSETGVADIGLVLGRLAFRFTVTIGVVYLVLAGLDYAWHYIRLEQSLRMTRQEAIEEHKESEGNPQVKARLRALAMAMTRQRMMQKVPTADVVVTNPTHIAVALRYDVALAPAPIVVAMGQRKLAERIKEIARKSGVPLVENRPVARALLATARVGFPIPPALYAAVAEILGWVYRQRRGAGISRLQAAVAAASGGAAAPRPRPGRNGPTSMTSHARGGAR